MKRKSEAGFSYIDVMIALVILMVGLLAMLSGITSSIIQTRAQDQQILAKQYASSAMESIMAAKETDAARLGWDKIGNIGSNPVNGVNQGIFSVGWTLVYPNAGPDEVIGTADDGTGTPPPTPVDGLQRQIVITDICDPDRPSSACTPPGNLLTRMRSVTVTISYNVGGQLRTEKLQTVLTNYEVTN
jgi:type II secretory pathway pseudopilin PulG